MDTVYFGRQAEHCPGGRLGLSRAQSVGCSRLMCESLP